MKKKKTNRQMKIGSENSVQNDTKTGDKRAENKERKKELWDSKNIDKKWREAAYILKL